MLNLRNDLDFTYQMPFQLLIGANLFPCIILIKLPNFNLCQAGSQNLNFSLLLFAKENFCLFYHSNNPLNKERGYIGTCFTYINL